MMIKISRKYDKVAIAVNRSILLATTLSVIPAWAFADTTNTPSSDNTTLATILNHDDLTYGGVTLYGTID
ncbi:MAG: hypothetical protein KGO49_14985, partial [Gammaproteobacteria bacterium]|nr:hypothetical protein [Gammaproteobacteria bacterium]